MNLLTIDEAARVNRVCRRTLERHIEAGTGPNIIRMGRRKFIDEADNVKWLESLRQAPAPAPPQHSPASGRPA